MNKDRDVTSEQNIVIVGVGLIGGSVAAAVRKRFPQCLITGIGRSEERLKLAARQDLIQRLSTRISAESIPADSLVVICLPVDQIADAIRQTAAVCDPLTTITDAGSVKAAVYARLNAEACEVPHYVGSHPIAGGEQTGFEFAQPDLFAERVCVVTPESASTDHVRRVVRFWKSLDCEVRQMTAHEHDRILAFTSHLPHVLAAVAAASVTEDHLEFTGSGFRDTTRIAAGSADLWTRILLGNRHSALAAVQQARERLTEFVVALENADAESLGRLLSAASHIRHQLNDRSERSHE